MVSGLVRAADLRWRRLLVLMLVSLAQTALVAPAPFLVQRAFEVAVGGVGAASLIAAVGGLVALLVAAETTAALVRDAAQRMAKHGSRRIRERVAAALLQLPLDYVERDAPRLHDVAVHDTERTELLMMGLIAVTLPALTLVVGLSVVLSVVHPIFGLCTIGAAVIVAIVERLARRRAARRLDAAHAAFGEFSRGLWSTLGGYLSIRSHGAEAQELEARRADAAGLQAASAAAGRAHVQSVGISRSVSAAIFGALVLAAGLLVHEGAMSVPTMLAVSATVALLRAPLNSLSQVAPGLQEGWRSWGRVAELLAIVDRERQLGPVVAQRPTRLDVEGLSCEVGNRRLFTGLSFTMRRGESVALMGPNGAGKSTLIKHLLGLLTPAEGTVRVDGVSLADSDSRQWRQAVGVVPQDGWLFDGTVRDNLRFGAPDATDADLARACRLACADRLVASWPKGLDTVVGHGGVTVSDGERQRLVIARALTRRPAFLLLDEPTNHLDDDTARDILHGILEEDDPPGVLLVTHHPGCAAMTRRLLRLDSGRLREMDRGSVDAVVVS